MSVISEKPLDIAAELPTAGRRRVFLVGEVACAARGQMEAECRGSAGPEIVDGPMGGGKASGVAVVAVDSILDAVFASGQLAADESRLFVISVGPEREVLEGALRSLRGLNPEARMVLWCEPMDEMLCRQARAWGADDYFIVPLDGKGLRQTLGLAADGTNGDRVGTTPLAGRFARVAGEARPSGPVRGDMPTLPLLVQTELLDDLMTGRPDFAQRAVPTLARYIGFGGTLRFVAAGEGEETEKGAAKQIRRVVPGVTADQAPFGTLILDVASEKSVDAAGTGCAPPAALLAQAANWLSGMLSLAQRYEQLRIMAITDELSGAYNRRYFMKYMGRLLEESKKNRSHLTLLLFDIDDFKKYNDTFGHASGDAIIRELIKLLRACTRPKDLVARVGGDEFAVVYWDNEAKRQPNSEHPKDVLVATERFREAIKNHQWPQTCKIKGEVSISGGLATFPGDADSLEVLMAKADEALLKAKAAGKNVIVMQSAGAVAKV